MRKCNGEEEEYSQWVDGKVTNGNGNNNISNTKETLCKKILI